MSKKVLGIGLIIGGMALMFIPGVGTALGMGMISTALGISTAAVVGLGMMVAGNVLMGPSMPKMPGSLADGGRDRLFANLDPTTPRKIVFGGTTAMATDIRYQTFTGSKQEYLEQIVCVASHEVQSIDEIWLDNEKAWTAAGGPQGRYSGYLTVATRTLGTAANGIAIDSVWTVNSTLTGCAYVHLKFKLTGNSEKAQSPFSSGVTSRMTIRGKGAKVYDPRLDSTVAGGSGSHRANDQTTWTWSDNGSRNPALQLLWYELGWKIGTTPKLAVGKGVPPARLDLASYGVAANVCDESVTKVDLTTEPRYRSDGVLSEGDDPSAVREALCATMNAILRDAGGKLSLTVLTNDLASPAATFTADHVVGAIDWDQTPSLHNSVNIVRGRRIDPTDNALYQPVDFAEVKITSPDGIDRIETVDYPLVQSNSQAQRLAKQRLQRNQYQGRLQLTGTPAWWQINIGSVFQFTHSAFGWTNKLFRCAALKISRSGETEIVAVEENAAIYAWDKEEGAAVTAGAPTIYDPLNDPFAAGIADALDADIAGDNPVIIFADNTGTPKAGELSKVLAYKLMRLGSALTSGVTWTATLISGNVTFTISGTGTATLTITGPTTSALAVESVIRLTATYTTVVRAYDIKVLRQDDPPTNSGTSGNPGTTATTTTLSNATATSYPAGESSVLAVKAGTAGEVVCTAPLAFKRTPGTVDGLTGAFGKWQWRVPAGAWADITTEIADSGDAETITNSGDPTINLGGSLSVAMTKTGLTSGSDYEFKLLWRKVDVSGDVDNIYRTSGTMQAKGQ